MAAEFAGATGAPPVGCVTEEQPERRLSGNHDPTDAHAGGGGRQDLPDRRPG